MKRCIAAMFTTVMVVAAAGCSGLPALPRADDAPSAGPAPVSTATPIVWFPITATSSPQPRPTAQPTADKKPGVGQSVLSDDFSSPKLWNTAIGAEASVAVTKEGLTIAAQPGIAPVASFRQGVLFSDMYAEVTARPSLCRGPDDYGLLFRAPNNVAFYRYAVACDGTASAERISLGAPRTLQPPTPSADVPVGDVRLGVWAVSHEFRFFLNGHYQFTASDDSYSVGSIGVFAHAAGETPVTVTFSDLSVFKVEDGSPVPSATP
jgi:hypothetical protein